MPNQTQSGDIQPGAEKKRDQPSKIIPVCIGLIWVALSGVLVFNKIQQQAYGLPVAGKVFEVGKPVFQKLPKGATKTYRAVWVRYSIAAVNYKQRFEFNSTANIRVGSLVSLFYIAENPGEAWMRESMLPLAASAIALLWGLVFLYKSVKLGAFPD